MKFRKYESIDPCRSDLGNWINIQEKPIHKDYYLCIIQGFSCNCYGNYCRCEVVYFNGKNFGPYPIKSYYKDELVENEDVEWWMPLPALPITISERSSSQDD